MPDQLFRVVGSGTYLADEPDNKGRLRVDGFVVPVEPDYEAALKLHRDSWHPLISGAQCDDELGAVKLLVDAALKGADNERS